MLRLWKERKCSGGKAARPSGGLGSGLVGLAPQPPGGLGPWRMHSHDPWLECIPSPPCTPLLRQARGRWGGTFTEKGGKDVLVRDLHMNINFKLPVPFLAGQQSTPRRG